MVLNSIWRIELLGCLKAHRDGRTVARFQTGKTGALLGYLAYHLGQNFPREVLIELLWPEIEVDRGQHNLRQALSSLRRQLEPPDLPAGAVIQSTRQTVALNPQTVSTDLATFLAAAQFAMEESGPEERVISLRRAVELYRGELLPGYYEDWVLAARERLAALSLRLLRQLIAALEARGELDIALDYAYRAVGAAPLEEEPNCDLMRLYSARGQYVEARNQFQRFKRRLRRELDQEPSRWLQEFIEQLPQGSARPPINDAPPPRPPDIPDDPLSKMGWEPTPAPGETAPPTAEITVRLPLKLTRFFGREGEITDLIEWLRPGKPVRETTRLVTLTGPGGSGKTRLAVEVGQRLAGDRALSVYFVPLASLTDPSQIPDAILAGLGAPQATLHAPLEQVVRALPNEPALLILDNFEQLIKGGAELVWRLLEMAPLLRCLVTSRQRLHLEGERELELQPLSVPNTPGTPLRLLEFPSVQLFVDRAQQVRPDFQITARNAAEIAAICEKLEGIPLAIELAAARVRILTLGDMLEQLKARLRFLGTTQRNIEGRHQTMRAAIDWSYQPLSPSLKRFFAGLSVFRAGWTQEAAEAVCEEPEAQDYLQQLEECSLITAGEVEGEMRFQMLETVREFAAEKLDETQHKYLPVRHANYFVYLVETIEGQFQGKQRHSWLDRLTREHDNLRAVLAWAEEGDIRLRLVSSLWPFWEYRGHFQEGREWLRKALQSNSTRGVRLRARALNGAAVLAMHQGDYGEARQLLEESLALWRSLDNPRGIAEVLNNLGTLADEQGDYDIARVYHEQSLQIHRALGNRSGIAALLNNLGQVGQNLGDIPAALARYKESVQIYRELGDTMHLAIPLNNLASVLSDQGEQEAARLYFEECLAIFRAQGNIRAVAVMLHNIGNALGRQNDPLGALPLLQESLRMRRQLGDRAGLTFTLSALGYAFYCLGDDVRSVRLLAAAETVRKEVGMSLSPAELVEYQQDVEAVRTRLSPAAFEVAWEWGRHTEMSQVIAYALEMMVPPYRADDEKIE